MINQQKKPRDYQRQRVYDLDERLKYAACMADETTYAEGLSVADVEALIEKALSPYDMRGVHVKDGRRCKNASGGINEITIPRWARNSVFVLHELAHTFCGRIYGPKAVSAHGPEFVGMYRRLLIENGVLDAETIDRLIKAEGVDCQIPVFLDEVAKEIA